MVFASPDTVKHGSHASVSNRLTEFIPLSEKDTEKLIMQLSEKSCALDPMPTNLLLKCTDGDTTSYFYKIDQLLTC